MSTQEVRTLSAPERRRRRGIITMGGLGLFSLIVFAILPKEGQPVTYSFVLGNEWVLLKEWILNSKSGSLGFSIAALAAVATEASKPCVSFQVTARKPEPMAVPKG